MTRTSYRIEVERLLQQIADHVQELNLLRVRGARAAALRARKEELGRARLQLAQLLR